VGHGFWKVGDGQVAWLSAGRGVVEGRKAIGCPSQSGQADWGSRLREARNKALRLRAIPNIYFSCELRRSGEADAGRAYYAALLHHRLHFLGVQPSTGLRYVGNVVEDDHVIRVVGAAEHSPVCDAKVTEMDRFGVLFERLVGTCPNYCGGRRGNVCG
jgi:hypothetical protein